ncbi:hypothetical protein A2819_00160 [Candidatus Azambacteria bacterium RIFCSPHIGHO2_01_FULL_40_24]|uniref:ParB/Sulfiredoxin domain-containing protein n=1 Tax=Candidatus Azambacteria bacterium RIFCSPHIGHO2_01_FULL_40_24 TaxID=1797301 RepID=A0A1F5B3F9_9BACT|nr:MAG: hypothetical protein A2819_00160 [Candidatus Azambacteria bacterium RIFCSPHIGHO2_01_FULL_40_24]OGN22639.1 MAG: hypothetical protein A2915_01205 [Candidatus Yanofskybacteria bacterium RIFCSPLOWO2_01_FULL_41_34]
MEKIDTMENKEIIVTWTRPKIEREQGEVERVVGEFLRQEVNAENIKQISDILDKAPMVELSEEMWESLENTDSFHNIKPGHLEDVERIIAEYNQDLPPDQRRSYERHLNRFLNGTPMECPTIIKNKEGILHLVSGNTRLMFSRALKVRPKVVIGEIS